MTDLSLAERGFRHLRDWVEGACPRPIALLAVSAIAGAFVAMASASQPRRIEDPLAAGALPRPANYVQPGPFTISSVSGMYMTIGRSPSFS